MKKSEVRRRDAFEMQMARSRRYVRIVFIGFLLSVPFTFLCQPGPISCGISGSVFAFASAAMLGLVFGGLLRMHRQTVEFKKSEPGVS